MKDPAANPTERPTLTAHVVDPDPNAAKMLRIVLESLELEVTVQNFKHDIPATLQKVLPDFLVLDISLPGIEVFDILDGIYRDRRFARTKILICSMNVDDVRRKHKFRKFNLDRLYAKPLNADKFRRDIRHMITMRYKQLGWKNSYD